MGEFNRWDNSVCQEYQQRRGMKPKPVYSHNNGCGWKNAPTPTKLNRKRSSFSAQLDEDLNDVVLDFDRKMKLSPGAIERLEVADELTKDASFVQLLMRFLPENLSRKLALTSKQWRNIAYQAIRRKHGNKGFMVLWLDKAAQEDAKNIKFRFSTYYHPSILFGNYDVRCVREQVDVEMHEDMCAGIETLSVSSPEERVDLLACTLKPVQLILTYGSSNLSGLIVNGDKEVNGGMFPADCVVMYVLSPSIFVTVPDNSRWIDYYPSPCSDQRLFSSLMFPGCSHLLVESFLIPSCLTEDGKNTCRSRIIGDVAVDKVPRALIMYQYMQLANSKPGLVEVLQSLKTPANSSGFPLVTGIYDWLDGNLGLKNVDIAPVASGLLISGDANCNVEVVQINLLCSWREMDADLSKIKEFYDVNNFCCKFALVFYHTKLRGYDTSGGNGNLSFLSCMAQFRQKLPGVQIHGVGSTSGPRCMVVTPESEEGWMNLNVSLTDSHDMQIYHLVFVLLAYKE